MNRQSDVVGKALVRAVNLFLTAKWFKVKKAEIKKMKAGAVLALPTTRTLVIPGHAM